MNHPPLSFWRAFPAVLSLGLSLGASPPQVDPQLRPYIPRACAVPEDAPYRRPDGSILETGASEMAVSLRNWNALFVKTHPGFTFATLAQGSSLGIGGLAFKLAPFALLGREVWPEEKVSFQVVYHRDPLAIRVGHCAYHGDGRTGPLVILANKANPVSGLTTDQVARIFTVGGGRGDIGTWGQAGLTRDWARRPIHVLGPNKRSGVAIYLRVEKAQDCSFCPQYEEVKWSEVLRRVAADPAAISFDQLSRKPLPPGVKIVGISETEGGPYSTASYEDVASGAYPYTRSVYIYVDRDPSRPADPFVKEYLTMVLSREGQQALCDEANPFLPLSASEAARERAKLD